MIIIATISIKLMAEFLWITDPSDTEWAEKILLSKNIRDLLFPNEN